MREKNSTLARKGFNSTECKLVEVKYILYILTETSWIDLTFVDLKIMRIILNEIESVM